MNEFFVHKSTYCDPNNNIINEKKLFLIKAMFYFLIILKVMCASTNIVGQMM